MRRFYLILLTLFAVTLTATAQKLVAGAPSHVSVGEQFRLTYTINTQDVDNFRAGNFPDAFEVLMGPSTSRQSSFQMVNGHTTSSSSITFTYIICANKNGTFTIPPAPPFTHVCSITVPIPAAPGYLHLLEPTSLAVMSFHPQLS